MRKTSFFRPPVVASGGSQNIVIRVAERQRGPDGRPSGRPHSKEHATEAPKPMITANDNSPCGHRHLEAPEARGRKRAYSLARVAFSHRLLENATFTLRSPWHACGGSDAFAPK